MREIENYNNYCITEDGKVWSKEREKKTGGMRPGRWLKLGIDQDGYGQYILYNEHNRKCRKAHRLVAQAYLANPENLPEINHKDGNKLNNTVDNLEWCTYRENEMHKRRILNKVCSAKLSLQKAAEIKEKYKTGAYTQKELGKEYGVSGMSIGDVVRNKYWRID